MASVVVLFASTVVHGQQNLNIYWGDLHGHSNISDGTKNAQTPKRQTAADYYTYGRDVAGLDFLALTDHSCDISNAEWAGLQTTAQQFNNPGNFVSLIGYEWSDENKGHRAVLLPGYGSGPAYGDPYYKQYLGQWPTVECPEANFVTYDQFWSKVSAQGGIVAGSHPTLGNGIDWNYHDGEVEMLAEIARGMPASFNDETAMSCETSPNGRGVQDALARGYRVGFIGVSDTHACYPGKGAKTAVLATELTNAAVFDALEKRHTYAVSRDMFDVSFTINDHIMGDEFQTNDMLTITLSASTGAMNITKLEILKNNQVVWQNTPSSPSGTLSVTDLPGAETAWYYGRVTLLNGQKAWASPIWVSTAPEPSSVMLSIMGVVSLSIYVWQKRKMAKAS